MTEPIGEREGPGSGAHVDEDSGGSWADRPSAVFGVGALMGAFVLGLAWLFAALALGDDPGGGRDVGSRGAGAALSSQGLGGPQARGTRLQRCALADVRLAESLRAADPAMEQWEVHVGAMNQLVVGAISLQQATAFWDETRREAKQRISAFEGVRDVVRRAGVDCPTTPRLGHASEDLRLCARRVDAQARALEAAQTAVRTWAGHVEDMDMLRMGHLSPAAATAAWLESWRQGVREIDAYRAAANAARKARLAGGC